MAPIYLPLASPFGLQAPSLAWQRAVAEYDPDLRIFPSQKRKTYRVGRVARQSGGLKRSLFKNSDGLHPDTRIALELGLVLLGWDLPPTILRAPAQHLVDVLRRRDQWRFSSGDAVADHIDRQEADDAAAKKRKWKDDNKPRHRAAKVSLQYRTGARISLFSPVRRSHASAVSPSSVATDAAGHDG
jgi:hypothetical protein